MNKKITISKNVLFPLFLGILILTPISQARADLPVPGPEWTIWDSYTSPGFLVSVIIAVIITTLLELLVFCSFFIRNTSFGQIFKTVIIINVITVPLFWALTIFAVIKHTQYKALSISFPQFIAIEIIGEILVFIAETILIYFLMKRLFKKQKADKAIGLAKSALVSFCANLTSAVLGTVIVIILIYL